MSLVRVNNSVLSSLERKAIDFLVPLLPASVTPDKLTAFGTFGATVTLIGYWASNLSSAFLWLASLGLVLHWFGDSLDGNLARYRKIERPRYGYFLDQTIDVMGNFLICFGMGLSPFVSMSVALVALAGYHMISIYVFVRANIAGDFHVTVLNSGPTEMRVMMILMNTTIILFGAPEFSVFGALLTWCDITVSLFSIGFMVAFLYLIFTYAPTLREEDDRAREARKAAENQSSV
jgi:archaetidylinositol phosphate synthase